ncbi:MAG: hypothetical protein KGJ93_00780 [Patescibacteria group bacterium]|nr:hypothetical protein [Patescibacteria group bacterium]
MPELPPRHKDPDDDLPTPDQTRENRLRDFLEPGPNLPPYDPDLDENRPEPEE